MTRRLGVAWGALFCLLGCSNDMVLRDGPDGLALTYRCNEVAPQARSTAERAVVRRYGAELMKTASGVARERLSALVTAYDLDWNRFEQLVVEALCDDPRIAKRLNPSTGPGRYTFLTVGDAAPDFTLPLLTGEDPARSPEQVSLTDLRGKYVILTFWASWCTPCADEYPELVELERELGARGLEVLGVTYRDSPARALAFVEEQKGGAYRTLVDEDETVADAYRVHGIPETVVIGPNGEVVDYMVGWYPGKGDELRMRLGNVLPDAPVEASTLGAL